jgi:hypothetical protein
VSDRTKYNPDDDDDDDDDDDEARITSLVSSSKFDTYFY